MNEKIDILIKNFDQIPDEGKDELLTIGEKYLKKIDKDKLENVNIKISSLNNELTNL